MFIDEHKHRWGIEPICRVLSENTGREDVEAATVQWAHWFDTERVHGILDYRTPTEIETAYYAQPPAAPAA
ncbi:hypothetical protein M1C57_12730 [Rhodococcus pyridinivorans]|uniref:hypothetical protein n=1 Tax=Rhodococcus pyridinivorans TaxID=103816 RepID=UPI00200A0B4B|nr:hypothetical protein [Rhodococcus pyridinivorans]UPW02595.1 hypothetical protein M1C57_12730 [Rhodococcus pyridinivorans]